MRVMQISVAGPEYVEFNGKTTLTSIFKRPVDGEVLAGFENLKGDEQADLAVHGGRNKAVYFYSQDYYPLWASELGRPQLETAQFGENLTVSGCRDDEIVIGSRLKVGATEMTVIQPRIPCFKLGMRLGDADFPNRFWTTGRLGFYARVETTGPLNRGDEIAIVAAPLHGITVRDLWCAVTSKDSVKARQAMQQLPDLDDGWQRRLRQTAATG